MEKPNLFLALFLVLFSFSCSDESISYNKKLNFSTAFTFESNDIHAPGMIGSDADNSIFIATREAELSIDGITPERVWKFDISTNDVTEKLFYQTDLVSKQLHIVDDQLIVVGGSYINTYDLNISDDPITVAHEKRLSRFGTADLDGDIYLIGGDLDELEANKVFKWSLDSQILTEFALLPLPRSGARGTILDGSMYVFGGSGTFFGIPSNAIYKISMDDPFSIEAFPMNKVVNWTFAQKFKNLIYVAGRIEDTESVGSFEKESTIGVFNTLDNTYKELETNLSNSSGLETIYQMCILNDKMYIIYGNNDANTSESFNEWEVLVSDLD